MKRNYLLIVFSVGLLYSCKKEKDEEAKPTVNSSWGYNHINSSSNSYKFKTGTYWVYENDSTFVIDSVYVDSISTGNFVSTPSVHGQPGIYTEFYKMYFHHYGTSLSYNQTLMYNYLVRNYSGNWSNFYGQRIYATNSPVGFSSNGMTIIAKYLSINIGMNTFNNVDEVQIIAADQSFPEFTYDTYFHYCDSVGLIKKETELSPGNIESWSLKRWNIIR